MIFIPLPFVETLFFLTLLVQMTRRSEGSENRIFALLVAAYALQSVLIGLRWGYGLREVMPFQVVLAPFVASLTWIGFSSLARERVTRAGSWLWLHFLPMVVVCVLLFVERDAMGAAIIVIFLGYGAALLWLARLGPDGLVSSRLDGVLRSYRSLQITAFALIGSAVIDVIISLDFAWGSGAHAGEIVAAANVLALFVLGAAASVASSGSTPDNQVDASPDCPQTVAATQQDSEVAASLDSLMQARQLYKDAELNLGRIARRLNSPARAVSNAVNRIHGMSVSQYVNNYRIDEACRLLAATDEPVTQIVFESGFLSKSNFNREFLRVTGTSPTAWRQSQVQPQPQ
ncbi:helix-turn-helix domain-containing protein [Rhizobium tubonense]|uniref:AraC family transcriptional regulator n=1 Tax=Rhizobium tubonense TaxID=484088 RepID=A0A2W4E5A7_9HYPH|nr:AraC family transcriptional regulator [Rhizobium tubonense]PZM07673.1 AraC family transcriptional regulator [Rhizobium tubonense]